jgi:hypothetical protein
MSNNIIRSLEVLILSIIFVLFLAKNGIGRSGSRLRQPSLVGGFTFYVKRICTSLYRSFQNTFIIFAKGEKRKEVASLLGGYAELPPVLLLPTLLTSNSASYEEQDSIYYPTEIYR